jgi:hypothetical protein
VGLFDLITWEFASMGLFDLITWEFAILYWTRWVLIGLINWDNGIHQTMSVFN